MVRRFGAAVASLALATAAMPATAGCWNADETAAATVRELQSTLMVAALRCQAAHNGFMEDYNGFLRANRTAIQQMNDRIKTHFVKAVGPVRGITAYDVFTTSLANSHGAEGASPELCAGMSALSREAALMANSAEGLLLLAARQGLTVTLPEGACARAPIMAMAGASGGGGAGRRGGWRTGAPHGDGLSRRHGGECCRRRLRKPLPPLIRTIPRPGRTDRPSDI